MGEHSFAAGRDWSGSAAGLKRWLWCTRACAVPGPLSNRRRLPRKSAGPATLPTSRSIAFPSAD